MGGKRMYCMMSHVYNSMDGINELGKSGWHVLMGATIYACPCKSNEPWRLPVIEHLCLPHAGAGKDKTTLLLSKSLTQIQGNTWPSGNSQYTYGPAIISFWGYGKMDASTQLAAVTQ